MFERDIATGQLNLIDTIVFNETTGEGIQPSNDILISPDGAQIYVNGITGLVPTTYRRALAVFDRDADSGLLTQRQLYDDRGMEYPLTMLMSTDGNYIYVGSVNSRSVTVLKRAANGILSEAQYIGNVTDTGSNDVVVGMALSPTQEHLYVGLDFTENVLAWFERDVATGRLTYSGEISSLDTETELLGRPAEFVISKGGDNLYLFNRRNSGESELWSFDINDDASLTLVSRLHDLPEEHPASKFYCANSLTVSDNDHLFYVADGCSDNLQLWQRDTATGALNYLGSEEENKDGLVYPALSSSKSIDVTPDGRFAHLAADSGLTIFDISADTELTLNTPSTVTVAASFDVNVDVLNLGGATAHGVAVEVNLPAGVSLVRASAQGSTNDCSAAGQVVACSVGTLPNAASEVITLTLRAPQATTSIELHAQLSQYEVDGNSANSAASAKIDVGSSASGGGAASGSGSSNAGNNGTSAPTLATDADSGSSGGGGSFNMASLLLLGVWLGKFAAKQLKLSRSP